MNKSRDNAGIVITSTWSAEDNDNRNDKNNALRISDKSSGAKINISNI